MPTYRSINIALHSQFDIQTLPEYYPSLHTNHTQQPSSSLALTLPPFVNDSTSTCSVHVPVLPGSQFWIAYSVSPPVPEGHYFLFKLYIDGERVMSWSAGNEEAWRGKCMFGLFESQVKDGGAPTGGGRGRAEKRALCFAGPDKKSRKSGRQINSQNEGADGGCIEIKVHRAWGRKRVERKMEVFEETVLAKGRSGVNLINAGRAGPEQPKRFYKFALIDPIDQPFATFCYYYRTWEQLRDVGLLDQEYYAESEENDMSVIEPIEDNTTEDNSGNSGEIERTPLEIPIRMVQIHGDNSSVQECNLEEHRNNTEFSRQLESGSAHNTIDNNLSPRRNSVASGIYIPLGAPGPEIASGSPPILRRRGPMNTYRLSMPPSIKLAAPGPVTQPLPHLQKNDFPSSTAYRPHPAYPVEEWTVRTPSPVRSVRDGITTPPLERGKGLGLTGVGLMGVISSTWKRNISGTQVLRNGDVDEEPRSVSH